MGSAKEKRKKTWKCPECKKLTRDDRQFCTHCMYNVGKHYSKYNFRAHISEFGVKKFY